MAELHRDQAFLEFLIKSFVDHPEDVKTERRIDDLGVLITLHINQADMAHVIGRSGNTARAIRTLLRVVGAKDNNRVNMKIYEDESLRQRRMSERQPQRHSQGEGKIPEAKGEEGLGDLKL